MDNHDYSKQGIAIINSNAAPSYNNSNKIKVKVKSIFKNNKIGK
ncbi:MAG: hypothetical protein ACTHME_03915 [Candidatus Nitrosocosmicus sp.]